VDGTRRLAYVRGTYLLTAAPFGSSQPRTQTGKYVRVWRRDGRAWHIVADIWNTDAAVPEASPGGAHVDNRESGGPGVGT
jgi:hypothetical protein